MRCVLLREYDIQNTEDIQSALRGLLGACIDTMHANSDNIFFETPYSFYMKSGDISFAVCCLEGLEVTPLTTMYLDNFGSENSNIYIDSRTRYSGCDTAVSMMCK